MDMFGHEDVSQQPKRMPVTRPLDRCRKLGTPGIIRQERATMNTRKGQFVQMTMFMKMLKQFAVSGRHDHTICHRRRVCKTRTKSPMKS
jgi:hypothetical protein